MLPGLSGRLDDERIRFLLPPFQARCAAVQPDAQRVLLAAGDLRREQRAARAAFETQQHARVVVERPARDETRQLGTNRLDVAPRDEFQQVLRVRADVADAAADPRALRVGAPHGLLVAVFLDGVSQPVLVVFHLHFAQLSQPPGANEVAGLANHRVPGINLGQRQQPAAALQDAGDVLGVRQGIGQGLVANDVNAGLEKRARHGGVQVVGRRHDGEIDAVGDAGLVARHVGECIVGSFQVPLGGTGARDSGIRGHRPGHDPRLGVEFGGDAVHRADKCAPAAADDPGAQRPAARAHER